MSVQFSGYTWNPYTRQYIPVVGTPVDTQGIREVMSFVREATASRLAKLAQGVVDGSTTNLAQFSSSFKAELKPLFVTTHVLARGGMSQMGVKEWGKVGAAIREQYKYADNFVRDIEKEKIAGEAIVYRTSLYTESAWGAKGEFENVIRDREFNLGSLERRVLGQSEESCPDCIEAADRGWQPAGLLPDIGDTECGPGCNCTFEFENTELQKLQQAFGGKINLARASPKMAIPRKIAKKLAPPDSPQGLLFKDMFKKSLPS